MKKNNIFKHELNESTQANAALNCLKNRNTPKKLNESADFDARFEFRKDLRELASPVAKKAYMIIRKQYGDGMWRQLYMDDCDERGLIDMLNMYAEKGLNPQQIVNKMLGVREDEETVDYAQLADDVCASYRGPLSKLDLKDSINYIVKMVAKKIGKTVDALTPQELTAIQKAAKHSVWYVSEQEELSVEQEEDVDDAEDFISNVVNLMEDEGMIDDSQWDAAYYTVEEMVQSNPELLHYPSYMQFINVFGDDILSKLNYQEQEEDTTPPWVGRKYNGGIDFDADGNLQVITPDEDDDDDGEVPPLFDSEQERHDIALACSYCLGESFIVNDGDLDDIYYAVLKVFDSTYDAPATTDYKEVLQWCRKYYKQIENLITTEEQEEQIFKVRTKQGFVEVPLSSEVVDAFHDNLDPRYEDMDTQAALKGINGGARLAALIAGMMEQGYKPTPDEQHILDLHYNAKKAVKQSQADSSDRNINAYSD